MIQQLMVLFMVYETVYTVQYVFLCVCVYEEIGEERKKDIAMKLMNSIMSLDMRPHLILRL